MRFIVREQEYETLRASGSLLYKIDDKPNGLVEKWRLTTVASDYAFLRIDLDARDTPSKRSTLFHMVLNPAGFPERLKFLVFKSGLKIEGDVLLEENEIILAMVENGKRQEHLIDRSDGAHFCFPSTLGLGLLVTNIGSENHKDALFLEYNDGFRIKREMITIEKGQKEVLAVSGRPVQVQPYTITWADQQ